MKRPIHSPSLVLEVTVFWPCLFGVSLVVLAIAGPPLTWRLIKPRQSRHFGRWTAFLLSLVPGAFILTCFGISEGQQALFLRRMERIDKGWSSSQVAALLGPPDHVFEPGDLIKGRSYGPTNRTVVWSYIPPRDRGLLLVTREIPFIRFRSSLDKLSEAMVGGIFGLGRGAFILQLGSDATVIRKGSWE